jgi:hypothetical protein
MDPLASRFIIFREGREGRNDPGLKSDLQFAGGTNTGMKLDISSSWMIDFDTLRGGPGNVNVNILESWTKDEIDGARFYSGKAVYRKKVNVGAEFTENAQYAFLDFDNIQETARVIVNGDDCGIIWTPPYRVEIMNSLRQGENEIVVETINTWNNRLVGDANNPDGRQFTNTNIKYMFKNGTLLDSGIIGSATIKFVE